MSKYNIQITEINLESNPQTAQGTIHRNGEEVAFEAQVLMWAGTPRWKVKEESGLAVSLENSSFSQGERMAIARWLKSVAANTELVGKSSQSGGGGSSQGSSKLKQLEVQNAALQEQLSAMQALMQQLVEAQSESEAEPEAEAKPKRKSRSKKS